MSKIQMLSLTLNLHGYVLNMFANLSLNVLTKEVLIKETECTAELLPERENVHQYLLKNVVFASCHWHQIKLQPYGPLKALKATF